MRTPIGTILAVAVCALALCVVSEPALADDFQADVVVCGSSPAAVTAAVKAKDARAVQDVLYSDLAARLKADGQVLCLKK